MFLIMCVDKNNGILFNNRRISRDRKVIEDIFKLIEDKKLLINEFSDDLFIPYNNVMISDIIGANNGEFCFVENIQPSTFESKIEKIILYDWNRDYPADTYFDIDLNEWQLESEYEFEGFSHEKIIRKIYTRGN